MIVMHCLVSDEVDIFVKLYIIYAFVQTSIHNQKLNSAYTKYMT